MFGNTNSQKHFAPYFFKSSWKLEHTPAMLNWSSTKNEHPRWLIYHHLSSYNVCEIVVLHPRKSETDFIKFEIPTYQTCNRYRASHASSNCDLSLPEIKSTGMKINRSMFCLHRSPGLACGPQISGAFCRTYLQSKKRNKGVQL